MSPKDLYCDEEMLDATAQNIDIDSVFGRHSLLDPAILADPRVLENMLAGESLDSTRRSDYCAELQTEIKPHMRRIVVDWMLDVCEDSDCMLHVWFTAVDFLDRFLHKKNIKKSQFQLLATVCLFTSSKLHSVVPLSAEKLIGYTDNAMSLTDLLQWELVLLSVLKWEVTPTTSLTFSQFFLSSNTTLQKVEKTRRHTEYILILATSEYQFLSIRPSLLAAASVLAAHSGLNGGGLDSVLVEDFSKRIGQRESDLRFVVNALEETIENQRRFTRPVEESFENQRKGQQSLVHDNNNSLENCLIVDNNNMHVVRV